MGYRVQNDATSNGEERMSMPQVGAWLVASMLVAGHAAAQTSSTPPLSTGGASTADSATKGSIFLEYRQPDQFRSTNLRGTRVYGANNENIGEINDVLINRSGQVVAVIIGVGGFLGIGEKDVAVPMSMLLFQPGAAAANPPEAGSTDSTLKQSPAAPNAQPGTTAASPPATSAAARHDNGIPDRLILKMTKEQLQNAPTFRDQVSDRPLSEESSGPTAPAPPADQRP
jgi:sporulation protein YlmC with PRC-barrel domain